MLSIAKKPLRDPGWLFSLELVWVIRGGFDAHTSSSELSRFFFIFLKNFWLKKIGLLLFLKQNLFKRIINSIFYKNGIT